MAAVKPSLFSGEDFSGKGKGYEEPSGKDTAARTTVKGCARGRVGSVRGERRGPWGERAPWVRHVVPDGERGGPVPEPCGGPQEPPAARRHRQHAHRLVCPKSSCVQIGTKKNRRKAQVCPLCFGIRQCVDGGVSASPSPPLSTLEAVSVAPSAFSAPSF